MGGGEGENSLKVWMASNDVTEAFCDLADKPCVINVDKSFRKIHCIAM